METLQMGGRAKFEEIQRPRGSHRSSAGAEEARLQQKCSRLIAGKEWAVWCVGRRWQVTTALTCACAVVDRVFTVETVISVLRKDRRGAGIEFDPFKDENISSAQFPNWQHLKWYVSD